MKATYVWGLVLAALMTGCGGSSDAPNVTERSDPSPPVQEDTDRKAIEDRVQEMIALIEAGDALKVLQTCMPPEVYDEIKKEADFDQAVAHFNEKVAPELLKLLRSLDLADVEIQGDEVRLPTVKLPDGPALAFLKVDDTWYLTTVDALPSEWAKREKMLAKARKMRRGALVLTWKGGALCEADVARLRMQRALVLRVLRRIDAACAKVDESTAYRHSIIPTEMTDESVIEMMLLSALADRFGMAFDERTVMEFLHIHAQDKLPSNEIAAIVRSTIEDHFSEEAFLAAFSSELKALCMRLLGNAGTAVVTTPAQAFKHYERLRRRVTVEAIPFPVGDYVDRVADEPSEEEIERLFAKYADRLPDPNSPIPGFKRRQKMAFEYFRADVEEMTDRFAPSITDDQIAQDYEEHRESYRVVNLDLDMPEDEGDTAAPKQPAYLPLAEVAEDTRRKLAGLRAREEIDRAFDKITHVLDDYSRNLMRWEALEEPESEKPEPLDMDGLANTHGLRWHRTPLLDELEASVTDNELSEFREYREFDMDPQHLFSSFVDVAYRDHLPSYRPRRMTAWSGDEILVWKVAETEEYEPTLDEARDDVILAWKREKARLFARAEALKLAGRTGGTDGSLQELAGESHTVLRTENCGYFRSPLPFQPLALSDLDPLERPGRVFLDKLFAMAKSQIAVLWNAPETIVYVVRVAGETPSPDSLRDAFVAELCSTSPEEIHLPFELRRSIWTDGWEIATDWIADVESDLEVCRDVNSTADSPPDAVAEGPQPPTEDTGWGDLLLAVLGGDIEQLERIANDREGADIGLWAAVFFTEKRLQAAEFEGLLYPNTPKPKEDERLLTEAARRYRSILAKTEDPMLRRRVLFALAQTLECSTDTAEARELYERLAAECPDRSFGKAARRRLDDLNRPSMRDFSEWFWKEDLTPTELDSSNLDTLLPQENMWGRKKPL